MNPNHRQWSGEEIERLKAELDSGKTIGQVATELGRSKPSVKGKLREIRGFFERPTTVCRNENREGCRYKTDNGECMILIDTTGFRNRHCTFARTGGKT